MGQDTRAKIEQEIAEGKLGVARDRLHGLVIAYPDDLALRSLLGDVYAKLGYPVEAGRFWFLDAELSDEKRSAIDKFVLSCGCDPSTVLKRLRLRCSPNALTNSHARALVESLIADCEKRGKRVPTFEPQTHIPNRNNPKLWGFLCLVITFVFVSLMVVGAYTIIKTLVGW